MATEAPVKLSDAEIETRLDALPEWSRRGRKSSAPTASRTSCSRWRS
ncbi:MAG: hypothetical protein ACKOYN_03770 [Planctomycetota bacterium]